MFERQMPFWGGSWKEQSAASCHVNNNNNNKKPQLSCYFPQSYCVLQTVPLEEGKEWVSSFSKWHRERRIGSLGWTLWSSTGLELLLHAAVSSEKKKHPLRALLKKCLLNIYGLMLQVNHLELFYVLTHTSDIFRTEHPAALCQISTYSWTSQNLTRNWQIEKSVLKLHKDFDSICIPSPENEHFLYVQFWI